MPKKDQGHDETEEVLRKLEARINKEYAQAEKELQAKLDDYIRRFKIKDELKRKAVENGLITQAEYKQWLIGQLAMGKRWEEMRDTIAQDLANTAQIAQSITNGYMPEAYAINHNYGTFQVEKEAKVDTSYTLYDRDTVERLFNDDAEFYKGPGRKLQREINMGKQLAWDKKEVQSAMLQGILQGESISKIATRLSRLVGDSDRKAAIRNARTMMTGVQNAGRVDSYKRAQGMGIELEQEWLATLDGRTRHEHRLLDGQRVPVGEKFEVEGEEIAFPGDPEASARLVYNCRCTLIPALKGFTDDASDLSLRNTNHMEEESYEEWKKSRNIHSEPITRQDQIAENMRRTYNAEYRSYATFPLPPTGLATASRIYVTEQSDDLLYDHLKLVPPIDEYDDFGGHGYSDSIEVTTELGISTRYNAEEFAEILKHDPEYHGGKIRLLFCNTGSDPNGFAQQLADILGVEVLAPTEALNINDNGELFISDNVILADMWYNGLEVKSTGYMKRFTPRER